MPQQERTAEGEQRWHEIRTRAQAKAKKFFDRIVGHLNTGTLMLDEDELVKMLTSFALDERKREQHARHQAATNGQPEVTPEDQHFAELASAEMRRVPADLRSNDLWLRFVAKGIARARKHWEETSMRLDPVAQVLIHTGKPEDTKPVGCYEKGRATGEPMFTLLARDVSASWVVFEWVKRNWHTSPPAKLSDAIRIAQEMERWPNKKAAD